MAPWDAARPPHIPASLVYPREPAWWLLERNLDRHADRPAIEVIDHTSGELTHRLTYRQLVLLARRLAHRLRHRLQVRPGDRVLLCLPNCPELVAAYHAVWLAGGIAVPCDSMASHAELVARAADADPTLIVSHPSRRQSVASVAQARGIRWLCDLQPSDDEPMLAQPAPVQSVDDLALLLYTGGTTGEPKGAMLTHANLVVDTVQFATWYELQESDERCLGVLPLFHSGGLAGAMNVPLFAGATLLLMQRFNPISVARTIERFRATRLFGVPTMYARMLATPEARVADLASLRACRSGAAPLPAAIKAAFDDLVGHEVLIEAFGLTEGGPLTHANPLRSARPGSIGIPLPDTDARIVDAAGQPVGIGAEGELLVRGPQVMRGYWRNPAATALALQGGWLHTGDVARMDARGYFSIVDRLKESINCGGFKVWPREVEDVLYRHPAIQMAAVTGAPDLTLGEVVNAFVVLHPATHGQVTADVVRDHCRRELAPYKVPRMIAFVDGLPTTAAGKILRRLLRSDGHTVAQCAGCC